MVPWFISADISSCNSFSLLCSAPLYNYTTSYSTSLLLIDIGVISSSFCTNNAAIILPVDVSLYTCTNIPQDTYLTWEWLVQKYTQLPLPQAMPSLSKAAADVTSLLWLFWVLNFNNPEGLCFQFPFFKLVVKTEPSPFLWHACSNRWPIFLLEFCSFSYWLVRILYKSLGFFYLKFFNGG